MLSPFSPYRAVDGPTQRSAKMWEFARFSGVSSNTERGDQEAKEIRLMEEIRLTTWDVLNPINNWIIIILGGAGVQPSTASMAIGIITGGPLVKPEFSYRTRILGSWYPLIPEVCNTGWIITILPRDLYQLTLHDPPQWFGRTQAIDFVEFPDFGCIFVHLHVEIIKLFLGGF